MTISITGGSSTPDHKWHGRPIAVVVVVLLLLAACSSDKAASPNAPGSSSDPTATSASVTSTSEPTTTKTAPIAWPAVASDGVARAVMTTTGVVVPVTSVNPDGSYRVDTPCSNHADVTGTPISGANVVLDPGHGGNETGAVGPSGLLEKDVNFGVTQEVKQSLEQQGASVVLTRTGDYNTTIKTRAEIAVALQPQVFLSIHHNAEPDGPSEVPGNETYYQIASADSKRLAGLIWEEINAAFTPYRIAWTADTDYGAKYRPSASGGDYYGILRNAEGVTTVLSEAAFITNPPEEHLLADPVFQQVEAGAISRAIVRYITTADPGGGFVTPYPRTEPAGGGGGPEGCNDPDL
jgi:N-acetylmuramoyl-L-alanine amidase